MVDFRNVKHKGNAGLRPMDRLTLQLIIKTPLPTNNIRNNFHPTSTNAQSILMPFSEEAGCKATIKLLKDRLVSSSILAQAGPYQEQRQTGGSGSVSTLSELHRQRLPASRWARPNTTKRKHSV